MKKVITVTLNPCIDRTITVDAFHRGMTNHVLGVTEQVAGKGINVGLTLQHYHIPVKNLLFGYQEQLLEMKQALEKEGAEYEMVEVPGRLRVNLKIFDSEKKDMTECNEYGILVSTEAVEEFLQLLEKNLPAAFLLVLNGSVAPGIEKDIYARMIRRAKKYGVPVILDGTEELLLQGLSEGPVLIKPNLEEFARTFLNRDLLQEKTLFKIREEVEKEAMRLAAEKNCLICISMGKDGAMLVGKDQIETAPAYLTEVRGLQGAGDAMVAGICAAILTQKEPSFKPEKLSMKMLLTYALASAAAAVEQEGTQTGSLERFQEYIQKRI